jgi:putative membrane protein
MILEVIIAIILGIVFGMITGLIPGIHTNLVSSFLITSLPFFLGFTEPFPLVVFIVTMSISTVFLDFIPTTFLGAPNEDTSLSIQPAHELLLSGKANTAIFLSSLGAVIGTILVFVVTPILMFSLSAIYPFFEKMMPWVLFWICVLLIMGEKNTLLTITFFMISGFFGIASLNLYINQPLLPMLTGLFGISSLIFSINEKSTIPEQETKIEFDKKDLIKPTIASLIISPFCAFLPGLGGSQATIISSKVLGELNRKQFLIMNGIINTILMGLSFSVLFIIQKSRTGSAAAISQITELTKSDIYLILLIMLIVAIISFFLTKFISIKVSNHINNINYKKVSITVISFLTLLTFLISGFQGFLVLIVSTLLGLTCQYYGIRKGILMGCLLIPTILYYLPF